VSQDYTTRRPRRRRMGGACMGTWEEGVNKGPWEQKVGGVIVVVGVLGLRTAEGENGEKEDKWGYKRVGGDGLRLC